MSNENQVTTTSDLGKQRDKIENRNQYGFVVKPSQSFSIMNNIIEKNVEYIDKSTVVFISGSNLVCYDLERKTSKFLIRKCPSFLITSMSVGYKSYTDEKKNEPYICLGEYNPITRISQISTISVKNPQIQHILNSGLEKEKNSMLDWKITTAKILKNSSYCVAISKKETPLTTNSKLSFWKYTQEKFISEVILSDNLNSCCYNPQNPLELIVCGKGYLRLWNVFINEGSLKEHPQRFLRGKQEKEHNFIKAQFFENKSFMFIVGTTENLFYIVEGFQVIYDFNATFRPENIADLNIQNILKVNEEEDDDFEGDDFLNTGQTQSKEDEKSLKAKTVSDENETEKPITTTERNHTKSISMLTSSKEDKLGAEGNPLRTFFLINNSLILMGFQKSSITYIYKLEKDFKSKKEKEKPVNQEAEEKNSVDDIKILRLANNVKSTLNIMTNPDNSQIMFMLEVINERTLPKSSTLRVRRESINKYNQQETSICLYVFNRVGSKLIFVGEVFKEYFYFNSIKSFDFNEKKKMIFTLTNNNWLRCFDYNVCAFSIKHQFCNSDPPTMITVCPQNNIFGVCFTKKFILYALFKENIKTFCEFEVNNPFAKFTEKGDYIAIAGESRVNKNYCIYFVDTLYFNTVYVLENLPKIKKIEFVENDTFLLAMLETSFILGWSIRLDLMTVNLMSRIKEYEKNVESYYFRLCFKHVAKGVEYSDFDYDMKNDHLLVVNKNASRMSVFNKSGKNLCCQVEMPKKPLTAKIVRDLKCAVVGMEDGSLRIYKWPLDAGDSYKDKDIYVYDSKQMLLELSLHSTELNNLIITKNFKNIITTSIDGSLIVSNLMFVKDDRVVEFDPFYENGKKLKPTIEEIIRLCDVFEYRIDDIKKKDTKVETLDNKIKALKQSMLDQKETNLNDHKLEVVNLEIQKDEAIVEEDKKEQHLKLDLNNLKVNVENELQHRFEEHEKEKERLSEKYDEKLQLYRNEIERLNIELNDLQEDIENRFTEIINNQSEYFKSMFESFNNQFIQMKQKVDDSLKELVKCSAEYDDAVFTVTTEYKDMMKEISKKIEETEQKNQSSIHNLKRALDTEKTRENEFKNNLDQKVQESDKVIQKNAEIKKNIIDCTQRTITFQEQILETEKNLQKIAIKLKDLDTKNKHLEQIRFVLEHRMTSLDKEKAPFEGQCNFLEKQKNGLQEEFNKIILQINLKNQFLENKQSQLKACLIQNFEINDQIHYIRKKLKHLQNEIRVFIVAHQDSDHKPGISLEENKATFVALKLRQFYDKYFSNNIEHELKNYPFYLTKLQEETEKMNIANNFDLIMRDKGEEKLIAEKEKLEQIKVQKERGFKRMQNENTILIAECNRLRKNLHEVYMHVVDIEQKFEDLTKINPTLNKTEIVFQIKEFIKRTHNKIKNNIKEGDSLDSESQNYKSETNSLLNRNMIANNQRDTSYNEEDFQLDIGNDIIKSVDENNENIAFQNLNLDGIKNKVASAVFSSMNEHEKTAYENFLKLPDIKNNSMNNSMGNRSEKSSQSNRSGQMNLPAIDDKNNK